MTATRETDVQSVAHANYSKGDPWPKGDPWHEKTKHILDSYVATWASRNITRNQHVLIAGSGTNNYGLLGENIVCLDIVARYGRNFANFVIGSIERIPISSESFDAVICVGSVLNYADVQQSISELSRVLKANGLLLIEFERSDSAEFLLTGHHGASIHKELYSYNGQNHLLWLYQEKLVTDLLNLYGLTIGQRFRFHIASSLACRFGVNEAKAAKLARFDPYLQGLSRPLAHNVIIEAKKISPFEQ